MAFPTTDDRVDCISLLTPPSLYRAMHGTTIRLLAHQEEVGVSADGHTSAPPSGPAAAMPSMGVSVDYFNGQVENSYRN
jgi:hypothetical protein